MNSSHDAAALRRQPKIANVRALLEGTFKAPSKHASLILCTVKKGASSYAGDVLQQLATACSLAPVDLGAYAHELPAQDGPDEMALKMHLACSRGLPLADPTSSLGERLLRAASAICGCLPKVGWPEAIRSRIEARQVARSFARFFSASGCIYGPIRSANVLDYLPNLNRRKVVLLLRDPRDVLTSLYFSVAISHKPPGNPQLYANFEKRRKNGQSMGIDDFVKDQAPKLLTVYAKYCAHLQANPNLLLLRYEDMVADFGAFLDRVIDYWELSVDAETRARFRGLADFEVQSEDVHSHKRQVTPGDHRRKLLPETIHGLSKQFASVLGVLGYGPSGEIWPLGGSTLLRFDSTQRRVCSTRAASTQRRAA